MKTPENGIPFHNTLHKKVEGGFVRKTVIDDIPTAFDEAHRVQNNLLQIDTIFTSRSLNNADQLAALKRLTPFSPEIGQDLQGSINTREKEKVALPEEKQHARDIIINYAIQDPIDSEFVDKLNKIYARQGKDVLLFQEEFVQDALNNLRNRRSREAAERELAEKHVVQLSGERTITFLLPPEKDSVRMELPLLIDPRVEPVEPGPDAVTNILGAPLRMTDYHLIANKLLSWEGPAGEACRSYEDAIKNFLQNSHSERREHRNTKQMEAAGANVRRIFGDTDEEVNPLNEIPLYAIHSTTVKKVNYKNVRYTPPQPFAE